MKQGKYAIHDAKMKTFNQPFVHPNNATAQRMFGDMANDEQSMICRHAPDYSLVRIGTWDDETGITENEEHVTLSWAKDHKNEQTIT